MLRYVLRRSIITLVCLIGATLLAFLAARLAPGDPLSQIVGQRAVDPAIVAAWRERYGLDRPVLVQYAIFVTNAIRGDFGLSYQYPGRAVVDIIAPAALVTLRWQSMAALLAIGGGIVLGMITAVRQHSWIDTTLTMSVLLGVTVPDFVIATLLISLFALQLQILPVAGSSTAAHYVLPAITLALQPCAFMARTVRAAMISTLDQDYIVTARAKGLHRTTIVLRHALRNACIPVLTIVGVQFGRILGGAFVIETIFNIPGLGRVAVNAVMQRDYPVILAVTVLLTAAFLLSSYLVDLLYGLVDPRLHG